MKSKPKKSLQEGYHHGDLRRYLIEVGERLLEEKGIEEFTLRECARQAGVSPSAPSHHFGSVTGLLTAIATVSFDNLCEAQESALAGCADIPQARIHAIGMAYVSYALAHPARFRVAFGQVPLDRTDPTLMTAGTRALDILAREIRALSRWNKDTLNGRDLEASVALAWSAVHGIAQLLIDKYLFVVAPTLDREAFLGELVPRMLELLSGSFVSTSAANDNR
jgi:AcrR family transcriptional regulator